MSAPRPCRAAALVLLALLAAAGASDAQSTRIRDVTIQDQSVPVRLMGYGLVVGLDGTGDRVMGGRGGHTVQSVANLLRRFDVEVPAEILRMRNVAAVLVTAEVSPYLRPGGRFEVHVSSLGDARSLRGGVLWMTPLVGDVGGAAVATAQGPLLISEGGAEARDGYSVETTARLPQGGLLESSLPRTSFASASRLLLKEPDLATARRVADAINAAVGEGTAQVEDPGSVALTLPSESGARTDALVRLLDTAVDPVRRPRVIIDGRDGTVVTGGDLRIGEAVVSHGAVTLTIGGPAAEAEGVVAMPAGVSAQEVAAALHTVRTPANEIAAIFQSLREVGAFSAEVVVR